MPVPLALGRSPPSPASACPSVKAVLDPGWHLKDFLVEPSVFRGASTPRSGAWAVCSKGRASAKAYLNNRFAARS